MFFLLNWYQSDTSLACVLAEAAAQQVPRERERARGQTFQHAVVRLLVMWSESLDELCRFGPLVHHLQLHIAAVAAAQAQF